MKFKSVRFFDNGVLGCAVRGNENKLTLSTEKILMNHPHHPFEAQLAGLERVQYFPIMMFTITMGLTGLSIAYQQAHLILATPEFIGSALAYGSGVIFALVAFMYLLKSARFPGVVKAELSHPVRLHFSAAISISLLLLAAAFSPLAPALAQKLWLLGVFSHLFLTLYTVSAWINRNMEIEHSSPVWFLPIVGNVAVPLAGVEYAPMQVSLFFFATGVFFWLVLFSLILNRIIFHHQLPDKFVPTLFIFIAPPALAFISYYKISGSYDMLAQSLYGIALFFTLLLTFMFRRFVHLKFFISWWAFTFPLTAMTIATLISFKITQALVYAYFSYVMLIVTSLVITVVAAYTLAAMWKGEICTMEQ
jgi:tellurite resistance protein